MCNEYARRLPLDDLPARCEAAGLPPVTWLDGRTPNTLDGVASVRIGDSAPVVELAGGALSAQFLRWSWKAAGGRPVFNFVSEGRDFSRSRRVLVLADGFYEYTAPRDPRIRLKDRHLFELRETSWFWIAGVVRDEAFALLTTAPGADLEGYHDRQIVLLHPSDAMDWLALQRPPGELLRPLPGGALKVTTLRRDGAPRAQGGSVE